MTPARAQGRSRKHGAGGTRNARPGRPDAPESPRDAQLRRLTTTWLVGLGAAATVIGGHDAVAGTEINVRLWGALVLGAGIVLMSGGAGLRRRRPRDRSLAAVAALLGAALGSITFLAQVVNDEPDERLALWTAIIVICLGAASAIRRLAPPAERRQGVWTQLPVLKSIVSVGLVVSLAQFWYSSIYIPTTAPASLSLESRIDRIEAKRDLLLVSGSVVVRNTSGTRVNVLASTLDVSGESIGAEERNDQQFREEVDKVEEGVIEYANRYTGSDAQSNATHGRLVQDGFYFEPGETATVPFIVGLPPNRFDLVSVDAWVAMARGKVLALETSTPEAPVITDNVSLTPVPEAGWLRNLTRGERFVRVEYDSDPRAPAVTVRFSGAGDATSDEEFDRRMKRFYGYSAATANAVKALPARRAEASREGQDR
jgi:hypothetical protein